MIIIFTGSSSFTGYHFIQEFNQQGFKPIVTFSKKKSYYLKKNNNRKKRVIELCKKNECHFNMPFSSTRLLKLLGKLDKVDFFCHHASETKNYKSRLFNPIDATKKNM